MECLIIGLVAFFASGLTLFSGFGLGTILTPAFVLFFPVNIAVAMTAVVHISNNLFKLGLVGRVADRRAVIRFGLPAMAFAFIGAFLLVWVSSLPSLSSYELAGRQLEVTPVKLTIGLLLIVFALFDLLPALADLSFPSRYLPVGGGLSGFFGGLSGNQGALRSAFLIRAGLSKEAFIATGVVVAVIVDVARLAVYGTTFAVAGVIDNWQLLLTAVLSAFAGAVVGRRLMKKVTLRAVQILVGVMLLVIAAGLIAGLI